MKIISLPRGKGKTTDLVKKSHDGWIYIICKDQQRLGVIMETAKRMNLDIPYPITLRELPIGSRWIKAKGVLVDDMDELLETIIGCQVEYATTSCEIIGGPGCNIGKKE